MATKAVIDGRFSLAHEHRRGGMGTVWRGIDLTTSRPVAVKLLHSAGSEPGERFRREAALLAELAHGSIVSYVASGVTGDGVPYLAMEWLEGETLAERLARQPLGLREAVALTQAVARGLAVAHRRGIVHRDLKPSNLFLRAGAPVDVVLLDLGIARRMNATGALTQAGAVLGTPSYMAPEQAQGAGDTSLAADVFSLGCVLFECLAGRPPFTGNQVLTVLAKVLFEDTPRLRELRPELPVDLAELVMRMLAKSPAERPADADAVLAGLARLAALPDLAGPDGQLDSPRTTPRGPTDEQQLLSVIVATRDSAAGGDDTLAAPPLPDVTPFGAEMRHLADGTIVLTLEEKRGAATDLAVRAARCALRVRDLREGWQVALATGRGLLRGRVHLGEAVDRAASLLAGHTGEPAGQVWIDAVTAGLLGSRFQVVDHGRGAVLEHEDPTIDPTRPLCGQPTACVGREHELGTLELSLRACIDESSPRATLVVGPPGQGKSRLRHELVRRCADRDLAVLLGLGDPIRTASGCGLLGRALLRFAGAPEGGSEAERRDSVARLAAGLPGPAAAFLGELCGLALPADAPDELRVLFLDPRTLQQHIGRAWLAFLRAELARRPVLIVLDDLQWSDALTLSLVDLALRELADSPLCVLALARPEIHEQHPGLWAAHLAVLPLRPLAPAQAGRLVRQVLGELPPARLAALVERAAGNALYLEELIRAADARSESVPATVLAMLQARIGALPASARRLLRAASVLGERFPLAGLQALLEGDSLVDLDLLVGKELLEAQDAGHYRFRHALMRDAAYALLTDEDRAASHGLAARYFEAAGDAPGVIAAHYQRGGEDQLAVPHYLAAAEQAYRGNDMVGAVGLVRAGLAAGATGQLRGELQAIAAPVTFYVWDFAACWAAATEAVALLPVDHRRRAQGFAWRACVAMQLGKLDEVAPEIEEILAARPAEEDVVEFAIALSWTVLAHSPMGNREHVVRLVDRLAELSAQVGERMPLVHATYQHGLLRLEQMLGDDLQRGWLAAREATRIYDASDFFMFTLAAIEVGDLTRRLFPVEEAIAVFRPVVARAQAEAQPLTQAFAEQHLAVALAAHGSDEDQAEARRLGESVLALTGKGNAFSAFGHRVLALVALRAGDLAAAEREAELGRDEMRTLGMLAYYPHFDATLLEVLIRRGDPRLGALADETQAHLERLTPLGSIELSAREVVVRALLSLGRLAAARRVLAAALVILERRRSRLPAELHAGFDAVHEHASLRHLLSEIGQEVG